MLANKITHLVGVCEFELPPVSRPTDVWLARFVREQFEEELPELDGPASLVSGQERGWDHGLAVADALMSIGFVTCFFRS